MQRPAHLAVPHHGQEHARQQRPEVRACGLWVWGWGEGVRACVCVVVVGGVGGVGGWGGGVRARGNDGAAACAMAP